MQMSAQFTLLYDHKQLFSSIISSKIVCGSTLNFVISNFDGENVKHVRSLRFC